MEQNNPNPIPGSTTADNLAAPGQVQMTTQDGTLGQPTAQTTEQTTEQANTQTDTKPATTEDRLANLERWAFQQGGFQYLKQD